MIFTFLFLYYSRSEAAELRRRQRLDKQAVMASKVKEMKRKQQACEEEARKPKKRRSMMITIGAGVGLVVCLFCVYYSYTKLGWLDEILFCPI